MKQYMNPKNNWNKDLKALRKQDKMLYIIAKKSGLHLELKNIKNIRAKTPKKRYDSSSDESYPKSSLSIDSDWDKEKQTAGRRDIDGSDHVMNDNIKKNKDQRNDAIKNEPNFDSSFNLYSGTKYPYQ